MLIVGRRLNLADLMQLRLGTIQPRGVQEVAVGIPVTANSNECQIFPVRRPHCWRQRSAQLTAPAMRHNLTHIRPISRHRVQPMGVQKHAPPWIPQIRYQRNARSIWRP